MIMVLFLLIGCGGSTTEYVPSPRLDPRPAPPTPPIPPGTPPIPPAPPAADYAPVQAIMEKSCLGSNCHSTPGKSGVNLDTEQGFRDSFRGVLSAVKRGSMPIGRQNLSNQQIGTLEAFGASSIGGGSDDDDDDDGDDDDG